MTELTFAKTYLSTLSARPTKLPADHAADLKTLSIKASYILPTMPHAMQPRASKTTTSSAPGSTPTSTPSATTVTLKSLRNPQLDVSLSAQPLTTSVLELKKVVAAKLGLEGTEKVRLLWRKKPCSDVKCLGDLVGEEGEEGKGVEFGVMVIGGVVVEGGKGAEGDGGGKKVGGEEGGGKMEGVVEGATTKGSGMDGSGGLDPRLAMEKEEFWTGLRGFVTERFGDEGVAEEAVGVFRSAWTLHREGVV